VRKIKLSGSQEVKNEEGGTEERKEGRKGRDYGLAAVDIDK
jgi:hypothetical protein